MECNLPLILVIDDDTAIHRMMQRILRPEGYAVMTAASGNEALELLAARHPDLILLDLSMPDLDGFQVASRINGRAETPSIPIILVTGRNTVENHVKAMDMGLVDFLAKTADPAEIRARVRSHLKIKQLNDQLRDYQMSLEHQVALRTEQLKQTSLEVIWRLTAAAEQRDNETGAHIKRMSHYSTAVARAMELPSKAVEAILYGAPMHDIGKIGIPDQVLLKPGPLTPQEWQIMKQHPAIGAEILSGSTIGYVRVGATIALTHHEKWDGSGYPRGLTGRRIPLAGRIAAIADVFDALTSERPYKKAFPIEKALQIITRERGRHFDPQVVDAFLGMHDEINCIRDRFRDHS